VGFGVIRNLIAHAGPEGKLPAVFELGVQLTLGAQQDVSFHTPVIG
jgi:hypothetical protein